MPLLPYHKYLGPGNELDSGDPVDEDDRIAQEHDSAYATALTAEDISKADEHAVKSFLNDFSTTGNWHSLLGAAGLTAKQKVESHTGILYPDMSHRDKYKPLPFRNRGQEKTNEQRVKRQTQQDVNRDSMQDPSQPSSSHVVSDIGQNSSNTPMDTNADDSPQADQGSVNPNNSGVTNPSNSMATLYFNKSLAGSGFTFFKKSRLMHSWGFASAKFNRGAAGKLSDYLAYTTSLAYIPVDWVPFYLSPAEFQALPVGSYIKEVYVEIIPKGVRCSFDTGATLSGTANSMHVIYGKHSIGLNHKLEMVNLAVKQNDSKPMTIASVTDITKTELTNRFYGSPGIFNSETAGTFPCTWGANRALPYYACIMATTNKSTKNTFHKYTGWPRIDNVVDRYNLNEHINIPCIKYSYRPRNGTLKNLKNSAVVPNKVKVITGHVDMASRHTQIISEGNYAHFLEGSAPLNNNIGEYETIVDKAHLFTAPNLQGGLKSQPQVHVGIEPVQSNAPSDTDPQFVNTSVDYEISCTCTVGFNSNLMYGYDTYGSKLDFNSGSQDSNHHYYLSQNHIAGFYSYNWPGKYDTKNTGKVGKWIPKRIS